MAKTSKSLRIDEGITNLIEDYCDFMNATFENNLTFSNLVPNALVEYMFNETEKWEHIMGGAEAGTKYKAFLRSAAKGGEALGLSFLDANNQLLSMPEILDRLRGKFGDTMDAAEKMKLQQAFGDTEAVALIDLMYNKVGDLQGNIVNLYGAMNLDPTSSWDSAIILPP